jgi:hypothetical protein
MPLVCRLFIHTVHMYSEGDFLKFLHYPYSTLLHVLPLKFHLCRKALGSNLGKLRLRHWLSDALTTRLDIMYSYVWVSWVDLNQQGIPCTNKLWLILTTMCISWAGRGCLWRLRQGHENLIQTGKGWRHRRTMPWIAPEIVVVSKNSRNRFRGGQYVNSLPGWESIPIPLKRFTNTGSDHWNWTVWTTFKGSL